MLYQLCRKWRTLLICALCGIILMAGLSWTRPIVIMGESSGQTLDSTFEQLSQLKAKLSGRELNEVRMTVESYLTFRRLLLYNGERSDDSILLKLNPRMMPSLSRSYAISNYETGKDYPTDGKDICDNIAEIYKREIRSAEVVEDIRHALNDSIDATSIQEILDVTKDAKSIVSIRVYGENREQCETIMSVIDKRFDSITKKAQATYRHKKQSGGAGQFGEVALIIEPYAEGMPDPVSYKFNGQEFKMNIKSKEEKDLPWGGKLQFINSVVGGAIDLRFMPAILKGVMDCMERGPLTGSYARDVRVVVYDGKMHPVDSNELSFTLAARHAFSDAFKNAGPKILEPIYDLEVYVPADYMGDVMSDLQGRRAIIMGMDAEAGYQKLTAKIPLKELSNYSVALSSLTGGRASFNAKFASYELVPNDLQSKLIAQHEEEVKEEE